MLFSHLLYALNQRLCLLGHLVGLVAVGNV